MSVLGSIAWLFSYLCAWCLFIYFGYHWSHDIASVKATAFWLLMSIVLGVVGGLITSRMAQKETPAD
jgi:TRAP-type C4-dicarboxylate transport system permease small subunit